MPEMWHRLSVERTREKLYSSDIDTNAIREAVRSVTEQFRGEEWRLRFERFGELKEEMLEKRLERKLKALEKQLKKIERDLEKRKDRKI